MGGETPKRCTRRVGPSSGQEVVQLLRAIFSSFANLNSYVRVPVWP